MSIAALMGLVNVTGTLVLDSQGKLVVLPEGVAPRPGDVVLEQVAEQPSNELEGIKLAQVDVPSDDFGSSLQQGDQDALDIIAQIESGEDPTQNEDQATAAGDGLSSSISDAATVEAINPQVQAATFFETTGLDPRSFNDTQTNALLDIFSNAAPVTVFDLRNYDEESQDGELNLDFPIDPNGDVLTLTVTELPKLGTLTLADGTPVTLGQQLTQAEFEGLQFDAPMEYTAGEDAGQFTYTVDDGRGEINSVQSGGVAITINPINDIPVIVEPGEGSVTESGHFDNGDIDAGNDTATGQVVATDNDTDSVLAYSVANQSDQYGSISIDSKTGEWTYTLNNTSTATQALAEGQTATSEFTVLVTDDKGAVVTDTIVITITGTNDKPEFSTSSSFSGQVIEAGSLDDGTEVAGQSIVSGTLVASDVDQGSNLTFAVEDGSSDFGSLQVQPSGLWVFNLDNNSPQTQALKEGQTQEIQFTVNVTDDKGAVTSEVVTITITGTNDQPTFNANSQLVGAVTEAGHDDDGNVISGTPKATGTLTADDVDAGATHKFSVDNGDSPYGKLVVQEGGQWTFTLDNTTTETQALKEGETKDVSFTVKVTDEFGAVNTETVTITITGTNDAAIIDGNSVTAGAVKEAGHEDDGTVVSGTPSATGTIEATDVDADSVLAFSAEGSSNYGSFAIDPVTGKWTFTLDNNSDATQGLKEGQSEDVIFTVKVTDDKGAVTEQAVTITITGTNDQPTFNASSKLVGAVTEAGHDDAGNPQAGTPTATGTLAADDVDAGATHKFSVDNGNSDYGELVVQENGQWTFTLDNTTTETQALKEGETKDVSFTVKVTDEFGAVNTETVTITITGTNDAATIDGNSVTAGAVKEAGHEDDGIVVSGTPSATGTIEATDVDADSVLAFSAEGSSNYGSFAIDPVTGKWTFTLDNTSTETQSLKEGQSEDVIFTVKVTDDKGAVTEQVVTITITGTNDQPTFNASSKLVGTVTEAGHDDDGNVISGTPKATGTLTADDVDAGATHKFSVDNGDSPYGKLVVQEGGQWTFTLDNTTTETQALKEGETKDVSFTVKVTDEFGAVNTETVTITITGTNDAATIDGNSVTAGAVKEAGHEDDGTVVSGTPSATGTIEATDVDADSVLAFSAEGSSNYGSFAIDPVTGQWKFTLDNNSDATQGLKEGQSEDVIFTVKVTDDKGAVTEQAVTITITGTNDQPTFNASSKFVGAVTEAGHDDDGNVISGTPTATGTLTADDVDADAQLKFAVDNGDSPYGKLVVQEGGQWTFTLDNTTTETQALKEGETKDVSFTVKVTDEFGAVNTETVTITITGTNDAATIDGNSVTAGAVKEAGHEDDGTVVSGTPSATGTIEATDVDADSVLAFSAEGSSNYGSFAIDPVTGQWTFTLDNTSTETQSLKEGQSEDVIFTVKVTDDKGAVTEQAVTITITGTNDQPTFNASSKLVGTVTEAGHDDDGNVISGTPKATGTLTADDVDAGATHKFSVDNGDSPYGKLVVQEGGQWTFTLDNTTTETQALKEGETKDVSFTVKVTDEFGAVNTETVTITITGTNDAATIDGNSVTAGAVKEAGHEDDGTVVSGTPSATGTIEATDVDADSVLAFSAEGSSNYGSFAIDPVTGQWTFTLDNTSTETQSLKEGQSEDVIFTVKVTDDKGAVTEQVVTITITGTNDQPTFNASSKLVGAVTEAGHDDAGNPQAGISTATGTLVADDVDADATHKFSVDNGDSPYGKLVVQEGGQWTFTLDNTTTETQALKEGETKDVSFTVKVTDEFGAVNTETVTITITGTNDAATIDGNSVTAGAVKEAGHEDDGTVVSGTPSATGTIEATDVDADSVLAFSAEGSSNYGSFAIDPVTGKWTFTLDNNSDATQGLKEGQSEDVIFTVKVTDDKGAVTEQAVTITITGTNDQPTFNASSKFVGAVTEAGHDDDGNVISGTPTATGTLTADDVDADAQLKFAVDNGDSPYGKLVVQEGGQWTFTLDNTTTETQALKEGETKDVSFTVKVTDEFGAVSTETVTITITGTNDQPTFTSSSTLAATVTEAGHTDSGVTVPGTDVATGTLVGTDVDADSTLTYYIENGNSDYGNMVVLPDGRWTFTLNNNSEQTQALKEGQTKDVNFTVTVRDEHGAINNEVVTISIKGTNDKPTFVDSSELSGNVIESGHLDNGTAVPGTPSASGQLHAEDIDADAKLTFSVENGATGYGNLVVQPNGQWTFALDNNSSLTQALRENETKELSFTVKVTDEFGATDTEVVKITITGTNDKPTITQSSDLSGDVKEAGHQDDGTPVTGTAEVEGTLIGADVDAGSSLTFSIDDGSSDYGTLVVDDDGDWKFTLDNTSSQVQSLKEGQSHDVTFTVKVRDELGAINTETVTITVKGTNDQPTFTSSSVLNGAVTEAGHLDDGTVVAGVAVAAGTLTATDVDADAQLKFSVDNGSNDYGELVVQENGQWKFTLDNNSVHTQALRENETKELSFTVKVTDEFGAVNTEVVKINITGTNDQPQITSASNLTGTVIEAGNNDDGTIVSGVTQATGTLVGSDADAGSNLTYYVNDGSSDFGNLVVLPDGQWTFTLDNNSPETQALKEGQTQDIHFTVTVRDELGALNTEVITILVKGTNDQPTFTNASDLSGSVVEAGNLDDGTSVAGTRIATGTLHGTDIDADAQLTFSVDNGSTPYGNLVVQPNGEWRFTLNNRASATQALREGETKELSFNVKVTDEFGAVSTEVVTIDITGTNDAPNIKITGNKNLVEDGVESRSGDLRDRDPDANDDHTWEITDSNGGVGEYGTLTIFENANGVTKWRYDLEASSAQSGKVQALAHGEVVTETFTIKVTDEFGAVNEKTITLNITGTNDQPVINGDFVGSVTEDDFPNNDPSQPIKFVGQLDPGDVDTNDTHSWSLNTGKGQFGNISIDPVTGEWTYTLNNSNPSVQALRPGDTPLTETFTVTVKDSSGQSNGSDTQTITINISGTNDAPELAGTTTGSVIEDTPGREVATGNLAVSDIDSTDTHSWQVQGENPVNGKATGTYGQLSVDDNGKWTYELDSDSLATRSIPPGMTVTDTFQVVVTDAGGLTDTITVTVSVAGTNSEPEIVIKPEYTVIEDGAALSGTIIAGIPTQDQLDNNVIGGGDPDQGEIVSWSVLQGGQYGTFSIDEATGTWTYVLNNNHPDVDSLDKGDILPGGDTVQVRVRDKYGVESIQEIKIVIEGENDAPNITGAQNKVIFEDAIEAGQYTTSGQLSSGDVDADDVHQWEISDSNNGRGEYGTLTMDSNGKWTFTYDQQSKLSEIRALKPGQIVTDVFEVKVTDSQGATSVETVTIQIEGQNDAPVVTGDVSATYVEDNGTDDTSDDSTPIEGQLVLTDYDNDDKAEVVISSGQSHNVYNGLSGELSIDKDGKWSFVPKNDVLQSLAEGETETEVFTILVTDRNGATVTQDITITIEGRNDVPVISGESTGTVVEDGTAAQFGIDLTRTDGQLSAVDVDNNSSIVSWSIESSGASGSAPSGVGTYGTLTLGNDGKWTYVLDNSLPATQALIAGETVQEKFYVVATDNDGGVSNRQEIVIDVIGQQDPGDGSGSGGIIPVDVSELEVTEDQQLVDRDSFIFPIPQGANFIPVNGGVYGQLVRTATGGWKYELDNDSVLVQGLDEGETATESWRIVVGPFYIDVNVTINGSADKPEITYNTDITKPQDDTVLLGEAHEDVTDSISGVLGVDDADLGDSHVWAVEDIQGEYGTLTIDPDTGKWTYVLDPSKELPAEKEVFDTFYVTVTDTEAGEGASTKSDRREVQVKVIGSAENFENPNPNDEKYIVKTITANEDNSDSNETGTGPSEIVISSDNAGGPLVLDPSIELGSQITWTLVDGNGTYGSIVVNDDGSWVFTLDNDSRAVQSLQEGETKHDVFEVYAVDQYGKTIVDDNGLPQTLEIVIDVNGQNDAPTLKANVEETIVADDVDQTISGKLAVTDIDTQDQGHHTWVATPNNVNNAYGTLVFNADGTWSYKVDPNNPDIIALGANETIEQTWTVVVTDPKGATATQTLTINIQGENQAPTMTTVDGTVTEDVIDSGGTTVSVTKAIVLDDLDTNDNVTLDPTNLDGTYGHFTVDPSTNTWKYVLFNDKPHVQSLGEGVTVTEEFTIRATDQFGAEVTQKVEVTVVGSNDQPTVSGSASGSVSDALGSTAAGKVTVSDIDVGDTHTFSVKQDSNLGTFTVDNNGNWKFVVDENNPEINALAKGQTKTIQVSVVATDSSGVTATEESNEHVINITIVGTNDAPQIVDIGEQMATENTTTQLTGNFDSGDVDTVNVADSHHWQVVSGDPRGELTVDPVTGAWTFNLTGDFEYLSEGETLSSPLSYQVKVTDEHGASDTITVNFQVTGTNDAPTIVAANTVATGTVHEDPAGAESGTANGVVTLADVDHNDTHSYSLSNSGMVTEIQGTYGTLKLIAGDTPESVKWEYVLDQDKANSLNDGPVTENFDLFIESLIGGVAQGDAIKQTIEVTVEGRNDAAIVAPESQTHAETDAPLQMSGNLNSTDVDNPDDTFTVQNNKQGTYGTFSIDANGEWTFVANQAFNSLNVGQSVEETFAVTTIDGTPTSVTVKIEGTNDAATVSVGSVERDETDAPLIITDTLTSSDVDNADNTFTPSSKVGTYGTFSIDANGVWTFVAKESFDHLNVGQSVSETFDVTSVDGTPSTVTVKINGTNDAADISAATENLTESNSILTANGTLTADDPDNANNVFVAQNGTVGNLGTFTLTAAGVWTFTAKSNFDNLAEGQKAEESFTVTSIDGTTSEVKIVITGTNDAATVSSADVTLQETDAVLSTSGTLTSLDIDNPDNKFQEQTNVAGNHGTFSIDADGNWTYIADESFNSLNVGQSVDDTFNVKSVDGTVSTVKVTIQGTNDAPSITGDFAKGVQEGVTDSVSGTVNITDVDSASVTRSLRNGTLSGDTFTATGQYGTLTFNVATGVWAYVLLTGSSNALTGDQTATETFYIEATDGAPSGDSVQPITITVTGNKGQIGDSSLDDILTATSDDEWLFGNSIPIGGGTSVDTDSQDTFRWETASLAGTDTIKDFDVRDFAATDPTVKHDVVDLTSVDFKADQQLTDQLSVSEQSGDTVIEISDSGAVLQSIVLEGVTLTSLLGVSQQEVDSMTPTEVLLALHQSEQLTLPDQIRIGTGASETLIGTDESDIIYGGGGNDILTGGDGFDLFLFTEEGAGTTTNPAEQTVTDFHIGDDKLDISDLLPDHDNLGDLLGNITITVNDDPNDNTDPATTVISVTNNGEQTDITLEGIGWNDLGIADSNVMTDQGNHQSELLNQLDHLSIIKVDP